MYLLVGPGDADGLFAADVRVTGPDDRPVPLDRARRAPDLPIPPDFTGHYRDHGWFTVPADGTYRVVVTGPDPRPALVTPPRSRWRQWWPTLLGFAAVAGLPLAVGGLARAAGHSRRPTTERRPRTAPESPDRSSWLPADVPGDDAERPPPTGRHRPGT